MSETGKIGDVVAAREVLDRLFGKEPADLVVALMAVYEAMGLHRSNGAVPWGTLCAALDEDDT